MQIIEQKLEKLENLSLKKRTNNMIIIGDVHGNVNQYWKLLKKNPGQKTIQVGDFGFKKEHRWHLDNINPDNHKINFGNHDDYTFLHSPHSTGNFGMVTPEIMTIRGASSGPKYGLKVNVDYWENEELNDEEQRRLIKYFKNCKPEIVISHDCPDKIFRKIVPENDYFPSNTTLFLQRSLYEHQPKLWIFGHHHQSKTMTVNGTTFVALNELETYNI